MGALSRSTKHLARFGNVCMEQSGPFWLDSPDESSLWELIAVVREETLGNIGVDPWFVDVRDGQIQVAAAASSPDFYPRIN